MKIILDYPKARKNIYEFDVSGSVSGARVEFYNAIGYSVIKAGAIKLSPVPDLTMNAVMITMGKY